MATTRTNSAGKALSGSWESEKREHPQGAPFLRVLQRAEILQPERAAFLFLPHCAGVRIKGDILFLEREYPPLTPKRKALIGNLELEQLSCLRSESACVAALLTLAAIGFAIRFASASIIRCRSAHLVGVQLNFRLPWHSSMRRAPAMPHSVSSLPPFYRHSRLTIVRRGCNMQRNAGVHGEAMYTAVQSAG